ncbi:MAG: biopolymer transporter ExbD [Planctomycetales bacterium]
MATRRSKTRRDTEPELSAFSDIAFLLIIFFILATTLVKVSGFVAEIPSGEQAESEKEEESPTVKIQRDRVLYNDKHVDMKQLRKKLADLKLHEKTGEEKIILMEAAANGVYQDYFDVMASINAAGGVAAVVQEEE